MARDDEKDAFSDGKVSSMKPEDMQELREALSDAEESESKINNYVDNSDQAKAIVISSVLTEKLPHLKQLSELSTGMIPPLIVLGSVQSYLDARKIKCTTRKDIYSEILMLMISHDRKGRAEFIELGKGEDSRMSLLRRVKERFGNYI